MALNKLKFNSLNVTPTAGKTIGFNSSANGLEATLQGGSMTFIKKLTASSSSTLSFVDGSSDVVLDNTYKEYLFILNNIHAQTDQTTVGFNLSTDGGSNYNVVKTTTTFDAYQNEAGSSVGLENRSDILRQSTADVRLNSNQGNGDDESLSGSLTIFNPSSSVFVKHFLANTAEYYYNDRFINYYVAGYGNTTSAVDAVQFKMSSGNIDSGTITLYGIN